MTLVAQGLAVDRGGRRVLDGVSFRVDRGGALLVTGPNAAGKSTLIRTVAGLLRPAAGRLDNPYRVALMAHELALKPDRTLGSELAFWARLDGGRPVGPALEAVALAGLEDVPVRLLSSGQKRRAAFARVLASGAPLWLLDEPAVGLDARALGLLETAIAAHRTAGGLVVATSHQPLKLTAPGTLALPLDTASASAS